MHRMVWFVLKLFRLQYLKHSEMQTDPAAMTGSVFYKQ